MALTDGQQYHTNQVHYLRKAIAFSDGATAVVSVGWLPPGAIVVGGGVVVDAAFNAGTANVLDIGFRNAGDGTAADDDEFATDLAIGSVGYKVMDETATAGDLWFPSGAEVTATLALSGTAATAGAGFVIVQYVVLNA